MSSRSKTLVVSLVSVGVGLVVGLHSKRKAELSVKDDMILLSDFYDNFYNVNDILARVTLDEVEHTAHSIRLLTGKCPFVFSYCDIPATGSRLLSDNLSGKLSKKDYNNLVKHITVIEDFARNLKTCFGESLFGDGGSGIDDFFEDSDRLEPADEMRTVDEDFEEEL